jgi:hypothetical protein
MAEIWEPWQPEPGRHVRVRLNGECNGAVEPYRWAHDDGQHEPAEQGLTGYVVECPNGIQCPCRDDPHHYVVWFDEDQTVDLSPWPDGLPDGAHYAAIELESLEAADAR